MWEGNFFSRGGVEVGTRKRDINTKSLLTSSTSRYRKLKNPQENKKLFTKLCKKNHR